MPELWTKYCAFIREALQPSEMERKSAYDHEWLPTPIEDDVEIVKLQEDVHTEYLKLKHRQAVEEARMQFTQVREREQPLRSSYDAFYFETQ